MHDQQPVERGDLPHRRLELIELERGELLDARRTQEALEPEHAGVMELAQLPEVARDGPAPEPDVDVDLPLGGGPLLGEGGDRRRRRDAVERHVEDRRHAARGSRARRGLEPLPLGPSGLVDVDVRIDQSGHHHAVAGVHERDTRRRVVEGRDALDAAVDDVDARLANALRRHDAPASDHDVGPVHDRIVARAGASTLTAVRTVFRAARWPGDVAVRDGRIEAVGSVAEEPGDEVIRCDGDLITAGLVNTHHHLYQWMTRGRCVGCDLFGWLVELYPVWGRLDVEDVRAAALVGLAELALTGCTTAADHHYLVPRGDDTVFDAIVDAARTVGIRLHVARGSMDLGESRGGLPPDHVVEDLDAILASTESVIARHHDGERVVVTVAPCSLFSVTPELMRASAELARRHALRLHTHLAETIDEERDVLERFGRRPVDLLDELGWIDGDVWVAHGIHFDDAEVARLGTRAPGSRTARRATHGLAPGCAGWWISRAPGRRSASASTGRRPTRWAGYSPHSARRSIPPGSVPTAPTSSCRPTRSGWPPRAARDASAGTTWAGSSPGSGRTSWSGRATTSATSPIRSPASSSGPTDGRGTCSSRGSRWCGTGRCSGRTRAALRRNLAERARRLWP